jgi:hypothetical protein
MGECPGPELPHATSSPDGSLPNGTTSPFFPVLSAPVQFKEAEHSMAAGPTHDPMADTPGGKWLRCRGLGKSVKGRLPCQGQNTAHGQITERKYIVARMEFWFPIGAVSGMQRSAPEPGFLGTSGQFLLFMRASGSPKRRLISRSSSILLAGRNARGLPICCAIRKVLQ